MTPRTIIRMVRQRLVWLLLGPVVAAALVLVVTRNALDTYASESVLYTGLVSGYTIESASDSRTDYRSVANAFDNLVNLVKARTTVEEAALRLLARQLVTDPSRLRVFDSEHAPEVYQLLGDLRSEPRVLERLRAAKHRPESAVYEILYKGSTPFAIDEIRKYLSVSRVGASDLLRMRFVSIDPQLTQWTLEVVLEVVTARHQSMKTRETGNVVAFFEREVARSRAALAERVEELRAFGVDNRVINYDEQTKAIAGQKEAIEAALQDERQRQAAAEAVLGELEARMAQQQTLVLQGDTVLTLRDRLADATTALTLAEATGVPRPALRQTVDSLETALTEQVAALYDLSTSREGLNRENLAAAWLEKLLVATDARAQVALVEQRLAEYQRYYDEFSPLGATLTTLEREVNTAEQTYLELLNSLNMARMREQNIQMASRLDVVDAPFFPEEPEGSNRLMLAIGAFVGCFGLLATLFVVIELFHPTIRSVERARSITKLDVATAYPPITTPTPRRMQRLLARLRRRARMQWQGIVRKGDPLEDPVLDDAGTNEAEADQHHVLRVLDLHLVRAVKLHLLDRVTPAKAEDEADASSSQQKRTDASERRTPLRIAVVGFLPEDGVPLLATRLAMLLRDDYDRVHHLAIAPRTARNQEPVPADLLGPGFASDVSRVVVADLRTYEPPSTSRTADRSAKVTTGAATKRRRKAKAAAVEAVPAVATASAVETEITVVELPPMVEQAAPLGVVRDADLAVVVLRADRTWTDADAHALRSLKQAHPHTMLLVLTEMQRDFLNGLTARGLPIPPFLRPIFG
ncbi:MAG: hypothetical protein AAGG50_20420 [Bacteroidota bacterium]